MIAGALDSHGGEPLVSTAQFKSRTGDPLQILKWLGSIVVVLMLSLVVLVFAARFGDGPTVIIPGGPLESGEMHMGPEPDWTFARDLAEMEFQLIEPPVSRTIWLQVVDRKLYVVSGYMNSAVGKLWKQWPMQAEKDPRAIIRIEGKRYERKLVRIRAGHPALGGIASEINRKYGAGLNAEMAETGDTWFFALEPR